MLFDDISQIFQDAVSMDSNQDNRALTRADSNHSVNSTVSQDSRDHKIPRTSKFKSFKFKINITYRYSQTVNDLSLV